MAKSKKKFPLKNYLKAFFYFFLITILFSFSTIVLHELGHFTFGLLSNCKLVKIVLFDTSVMTTYTEMECPPQINMFLLGISGFFFIIPISLILFFVPKGPDKYLAIIMLGFNFVISVWDFDHYLNLPYPEIFGILGILIIIAGEVLLIEKSIF